MDKFGETPDPETTTLAPSSIMASSISTAISPETTESGSTANLENRNEARFARGGIGGDNASTKKCSNSTVSGKKHKIDNSHISPPRKSNRSHRPPPRYVARPSKQGFGVTEGDQVFLCQIQLNEDERRTPKGRRERSRTKNTETQISATEARSTQASTSLSVDSSFPTSAGPRRQKLPMRAAQTRASSPFHDLKSPEYSGDKGSQRSNEKTLNASISHFNAQKLKKTREENISPDPSSTASATIFANSESLYSGAPRPPRTIIIGAGIAGLACARELAERRHDVLVLEARNRLGGRLRTIDLMLENTNNHQEKRIESSQGVPSMDIPPESWKNESSSDLYHVKNWHPVDSGGMFIHGTGQTTTASSYSPAHYVGSHDFGTSRSKKKQQTNIATRDSDKRQKLQMPLRKSDRLSQVYRESVNSNKNTKKEQKNRNNFKRGNGSSGSLNPVFVLAQQKLRLPVQAAEGAFTYLVDHHGNFISEQIDEQVSWEFNEILDLATKCCESGKYVWKVRDHRVVTHGSEKHDIESLPSLETSDGSLSPKPFPAETTDYHSETSPKLNESTLHRFQERYNDDDANIDSSKDFGTIFEECRKYFEKNIQKQIPLTEGQEAVRQNLFQWHVANLEMSAGAPMHMLGQRWNDDEPYGYGGDHSYLEGGFRDVIEALSDGFECRGVGNKSNARSGNFRRSGDLVGGFQKDIFYFSTSSHAPLGVIQCGVEVTSVRVVEREEAKGLRKKRRKRSKNPVMTDESKLRRSRRQDKGSKMQNYLDSLKSMSQPQRRPEIQHQLNPSPHNAVEETIKQRPTYGNDKSTVVHVTTSDGVTLEADAVVVTVPLAILSIPPNQAGHISFDPPLPVSKRNAINRLGVGAYNKCCMSFEKPFWDHLPRRLAPSSLPYWTDTLSRRFDFIGHASEDRGKDILFFTLHNAPILVAIYGGSDYSHAVELLRDDEVVAGCMNVMKKLLGKARNECRNTRRLTSELTIPDWPLDYFVTRWGSDPFSRGAFCYVPPGVNGFDELSAMAEPIYDYRPQFMTSDDEGNDMPRRPLVLFAGEATTPHHPSTVHGAFETGIREAYRLDLALEPTLNGVKFNDSYIYQPTFVCKPYSSGGGFVFSHKTEETTLSDEKSLPRNCIHSNSLRFDLSVIRGVESFSASTLGMKQIKEKMFPGQDTCDGANIKERYKSLMAISGYHEREGSLTSNLWDIPGHRGTWLAKNFLERNSIPIHQNQFQIQDLSENTQKFSRSENDSCKINDSGQSESVLSRSGRKIRKKVLFDA